MVLRVEVESRVRGELLGKRLTIAHRVDRRHELELVAEGGLEGEKAPLQNGRCLRELSLQAQVISNEHKRLMMVIITSVEVSESLDVHSLLDHGKLFLEGVVLTRFDKTEDLVTSHLVNCDLFHGQELRVDAWPVLLWRAQDLPLGVCNHSLFRTIRHLLLE